MIPRRVLALAALALMAIVTPAGGVPPSPRGDWPGARDFRFEWDLRTDRAGCRVIAGYVYNTRGDWAINMALDVDELDPAGQVVASTVGYVDAPVPPRGRAYFVVPAPGTGTMYRIRVRHFDWEQAGLF
jgi:hypothetical protein